MHTHTHTPPRRPQLVVFGVPLVPYSPPPPPPPPPKPRTTPAQWTWLSIAWGGATMSSTNDPASRFGANFAVDGDLSSRIDNGAS